MTKLIKILIIFSVTLISIQSYAQKPQSVEKRKKELIEKEEQRKAEEQQAIKEMQENHMAIQTKDTRKRMRKSKKKAKRANDHKKGFILRRLFTK